MGHPSTMILVLNYNGLEITKRFLKHMYAFTENFRLLIVDNGSTDGSVEFLDKFSASHDNVIFFANDSNLGVINGRNYSYELFTKLTDKTDYLCFLDNDQFVQEGWLDHHFEVLEQSHADIVGVEAWLMNSTWRPLKRCKTTGEAWTYIGCGGMLMKSSVPASIGLFDPQFNPCYFEDPDFCLRAVDAGYKISWNSRAKLIHIPHQTLGKNSRRMFHFQESHRKFIEKWKRRKPRTFRQFQVDALK